MKVVVTGASGFIGRALVAALSQLNVEVVAVSRRRCPTAATAEVVVRDYSETPPGDILVHLAESNNQSTIEQIGDHYVTDALARLEGMLAKRYQRVVYASS